MNGIQTKKLMAFSRVILGSALALSFAISFSSCTKRDENVGNVLRIVLKDDVKTLDPANAYDSVSWEVMPEIYDTLLQYKYLEEQLVLEPLLAESMPVYSKDGLTVTIKIKKGVFYADDAAFKANGGKGRELKAQDFIYGFKRLAIPAIQSQGTWIFEGKVLGFTEFEKKLQSAKGDDFKKAFADPIPGITALDDYTLEFKLTQAYPTLNYIMAMYFTSPVPSEAVDAYADKEGNLRDHPVGTGPYTLKSWETNQRLVLVKNPNFKGTYPTTSSSEKFKAAGFLKDAGKALPFADELRFEVVKEDQPRYLRFEKGEVDAIELTKDSFRASMTDGTHVHEDLAQRGVVAESEPSLIEYYVSFNMTDKVLQNKYLRQAISSLIDRDKWIETFDKFQGTKQFEVSPPGLMDRTNATALKYDYNVARAKELLVKAGYPDGKGLPVLNFDFRGAETRYRQMGEFFVQELGLAGIKVNAILNTFPAFLEKLKQGNIQISLGGWTYDYPDVENGFQLLFGPNKSPGPNDSNFDNPEYNALYKKMAGMPAGAKGRKEIVVQMENLLQEEVPWAYGYHYKEYRLRQPWVKNFRATESIENRYKYMRVERDVKK
jgi:oligopeptide transport system substrate-binding protein